MLPLCSNRVLLTALFICFLVPLLNSQEIKTRIVSRWQPNRVRNQWNRYGRYYEEETEKPWIWGPSRRVTPEIEEIREDAKECGVTKPVDDTRVVGGRPAQEGEFPWIVSFFRTDGSEQHICGGAIINRRWVITAGHCVEKTQPSDLKGIVGTLNLKERSRDAREIYFDRLIRHENYGKGPSRETLNDIALLRVTTPLDLSSSSPLNAICLPKQGENFSGLMSIAGWGKTSEIDSDTSIILRTADVHTFGDLACKRGYKRAFVSRIMICAGRRRGGVDSCEADSGGPLMKTKRDGRMTLAGLVSFGIGCARPGYPGVYTKVATFANWVNKNIR